jgi:transcriptional regulator with XRE-family HTH domain
MEPQNDLEKLRALYRARRLNVADLARRIGRSKSTVHAALSSDSDPGYTLVLAMAACLDELATESEPQHAEAV